MLKKMARKLYRAAVYAEEYLKLIRMEVRRKYKGLEMIMLAASIPYKLLPV